MREHPSFRTTFLEFVAFPYPHKWPPDQGRLKGNQAEDTSWPVNVQNVQICPSMGFICFFCQHFCKRSCFFNANLSSPGHSHAGSLFTNEKHKKVGSWRNRHTGLVRDIKRCSQKQNSSAHGCIFRPFKQSKSTRLTVQRFKSRTLKNLKKQAWKQKSYCKDNPEVVEHVNVLWHSLLTPLDQVILTETKSSSSSSPY